MKWAFILAAFVAAMLLMPKTGTAGQAYSESLMDCAVLFDTVNRQDPGRENHGKGLFLSRVSETLEAEAKAQAISEGRTDPDAYLAAIKAEKITHWDSKGLRFVFSEDFRDWMRYCRKFSSHLGIEFEDLR